MPAQTEISDGFNGTNAHDSSFTMNHSCPPFQNKESLPSTSNKPTFCTRWVGEGGRGGLPVVPETNPLDDLIPLHGVPKGRNLQLSSEDAVHTKNFAGKLQFDHMYTAPKHIGNKYHEMDLAGFTVSIVYKLYITVTYSK